MSEVKNPFAADVSKRKGGAGRSLGWIVALLMSAVAAAALLLWASATEKIRTLEALSSNLDEAKANLAKALDQIQLEKAQNLTLQTHVTELEKEKEAVNQAAKQLEEQMRADLESKDVTISKLQGKLTVNIVDRVMFDSGEAILRPDGESVLRKIAGILAEHAELKIHVIGHTDNVPIRHRFLSNWELSTARALAAVHFLTEQAGVAPERVGALGYGEYRPIGDNSTPEGRAQNRRIAVTILPNEAPGGTSAPVIETNTPSALQPENQLTSAPPPGPETNNPAAPFPPGGTAESLSEEGL